MATIHSARPHLSGSNLKSQPNSKSDFTDLFGPLEDKGPTTRIVRVPRLGYSSTLPRPPGQLKNPPQQPMSAAQEPSMFNSNYATMQSGPYGLGRVDSFHMVPASNSMPYSSTPFPYSTIPVGMPIHKTPYASTDVTTVSPLQTTFDTVSPYGSYVEFEGEPHSAISSHSSFVMLGMPSGSGSGSRKRSIAESREGSDSEPSTDRRPSAARRQKSSPLTDTARERYLEKNRRAATKCRSKQKKQQEDLVENARDAERKNKLLRAEVHLLKEDMRELMAVVGEHSHCPDNRLRLYVQREADRLATGAPRSPDIGRTSVRSSDSSRGGSRSAQSSD